MCVCATFLGLRIKNANRVEERNLKTEQLFVYAFVPSCSDWLFKSVLFCSVLLRYSSPQSFYCCYCCCFMLVQSMDGALIIYCGTFATAAKVAFTIKLIAYESNKFFNRSRIIKEILRNFTVLLDQCLGRHNLVDTFLAY